MGGEERDAQTRSEVERRSRPAVTPAGRPAPARIPARCPRVAGRRPPRSTRGRRPAPRPPRSPPRPPRRRRPAPAPAAGRRRRHPSPWNPTPAGLPVGGVDPGSVNPHPGLPGPGSGTGRSTRVRTSGSRRCGSTGWLARQDDGRPSRYARPTCRPPPAASCSPWTACCTTATCRCRPSPGTSPTCCRPDGSGPIIAGMRGFLEGKAELLPPDVDLSAAEDGEQAVEILARAAGLSSAQIESARLAGRGDLVASSWAVDEPDGLAELLAELSGRAGVDVLAEPGDPAAAAVLDALGDRGRRDRRPDRLRAGPCVGAGHRDPTGPALWTRRSSPAAPPHWWTGSGAAAARPTYRVTGLPGLLDPVRRWLDQAPTQEGTTDDDTAR